MNKSELKVKLAESKDFARLYNIVFLSQNDEYKSLDEIKKDIYYQLIQFIMNNEKDLPISITQKIQKDKSVEYRLCLNIISENLLRQIEDEFTEFEYIKNEFDKIAKERDDMIGYMIIRGICKYVCKYIYGSDICKERQKQDAICYEYKGCKEQNER